MAQSAWRQTVALLYLSEINLVTGIGDLLLITELERDREKAVATKARVPIALLWVLRIATVLVTVYIVIGYGVTVSAIVLGSVSLLLFFIQAVRVLSEIDAGTLELTKNPPRPALVLVGYASVLNFLSGYPYRIGPPPHFAWMVNILFALIGGGLLAIYFTTAPILREAWGCYTEAGIGELGTNGICPQLQSSWASGSEATCYLSRGAIPIGSHCQTLPWADTLLNPVYQVARTTVAIALGIYGASFGRVYDTIVLLDSTTTPRTADRDGSLIKNL